MIWKSQRNVLVREVFEAKPARVVGYVRTKSQETEIDKETILLLHRMLIANIRDDIKHVFAPKENMSDRYPCCASPKQVEQMIETTFLAYTSDSATCFLDKIGNHSIPISKPFIHLMMVMDASVA